MLRGDVLEVSPLAHRRQIAREYVMMIDDIIDLGRLGRRMRESGCRAEYGVSFEG